MKKAPGYFKKLLKETIKEQERKERGNRIKKFEVTKSNISSVVQELSRLSETDSQTLEREFNTMLSNPDHDIYDPDKLGLPNCQCTHPPSMGFCKWGMCMWGSWNFNKMEGGLTITINF